MQINKTNEKLLVTEVYIHDSVLEEFRFDRKTKHLHLQIVDTYPCPKQRTIDFMQVIGFEMTAGDYWGPSERILGIEYVGEADKTLVPRLFTTWKNDRSIVCPLSDPDKYIEALITFISGDMLRVACERIVI